MKLQNSQDSLYLTHQVIFTLNKEDSFRQSNFLSKRQAMEICSWRWTIRNMKMFYSTKCKAYLHKRLNTLKGVFGSWVLFLTTSEEIRATLRNQGVIDYKRITIKSSKEVVQTNMEVLTFIYLTLFNESQVLKCP